MKNSAVRIEVDMQEVFLEGIEEEFFFQSNLFETELDRRGITTIRVLLSGIVQTPLMKASEYYKLQSLLPASPLVFQPKESDLICLKTGCSAFNNPALLEYLEQQGRPPMIITGTRAGACVRETVADALKLNMRCFVPLELITDGKQKNKPYGSGKFIRHNKWKMRNAGRDNPDFLSTGSSSDALEWIDEQKERPTPGRSRPPVYAIA